jgi:hypothetical protein
MRGYLCLAGTQAGRAADGHIECWILYFCIEGLLRGTQDGWTRAGSAGSGHQNDQRLTYFELEGMLCGTKDEQDKPRVQAHGR